MTNRGFIDLRQNSGSGSYTDDSVWPSFTDIMTVVVMIFLMALVVILLRNTELTDRLRATIEREQNASQLAAARGDETTSLRASVERLSTSLKQTESEHKALEVEHAELDEAYSKLEVEQHSLVAANEDQASLIASQTRSLAAADATRAALALSEQAIADQRSTLLTRHQSLAATLEETESQLVKTNVQVTELEKTLIASEAARRSLAVDRDGVERERVSLIGRGRQLARGLAESQQQRSELTTRAVALERELSTVETERDALQTRTEELGEAVRVAQTESQQVAAELESAEVALDTSTARIAALDKEVSDKLATLEREGDAKRGLEEQLVVLNSTGAALESKLEETEGELSKTREERELLLSQINRQREENVEQVANIKQLQQQLATISSERVQLEQSLSQFESDKLEAQAQTDSLQSALERQTNESEDLTQAIDILKGDIERLQQETQVELSEKDTEIETLGQKNEATTAANTELREQLIQFDRTVESLKTEKLTLEDQLAALNAKYTNETTILTENKERNDAELARLTAEVEQMKVVVKEKEETAAGLLATIAENKGEIADLEKAQDEVEAEKQKIAETLQQTNLLAESISAERSQLIIDLQGLGNANEKLILTQAALEDERNELYDKLQLDQEELDKLKLTYVDLKGRYDRLVGPARSPIGRVVVDIRFYRRGDETVIELREPNWKSYREVNAEQLDVRLARLAKDNEANLYTRIIFPQGNGLSYNEAFRFESRILERFDYYGQSQEKSSRG